MWSTVVKFTLPIRLSFITVYAIYHLIVLLDAFQLNAVIISPRCGQTFTSEWGNMTYPDDFPRRSYPFGLRCRWKIQLPDEKSQVELSLPYLTIRSMDYLVLMDGKVNGGSRPCDSFAYSNAISFLNATGNVVSDHLRVIRGAASFGTDEAAIFRASNNVAIIDFCPSSFPLGTLDGLGVIFMWDSVARSAVA